VKVEVPPDQETPTLSDMLTSTGFVENEPRATEVGPFETVTRSVGEVTVGGLVDVSVTE